MSNAKFVDAPSMKVCSRCGKEKFLDDFSKDSNRPPLFRRSECKECQRESAKKSRYASNASKAPKITKEPNRNKGKRARKLIVWLYKKYTGCEHCGNKNLDPKHLDLHHRDPKEKVDGISEMICNLVPIKVLIRELLKCDCVCAICHRELHYQERVDPIFEAQIATFM